jgi:HEAT repeat protein
MKVKNQTVKQVLRRSGRLIFAAFLLFLISCSSVEKELEGLNSSDALTRRDAVVSLAHRLKPSDTGESPQHNKIVHALVRTTIADPNPYVRAAALSSLVENAPVDSPETVSACLKDSNPLVREEAVRAAGKTRIRFLTTAIIKLLLEDPDVSVRRISPVALVSIASLRPEPPPEILEALCNVLQDEEDSVKFAARDALRRLLGTDVGESPENWKRLLEQRRERK